GDWEDAFPCGQQPAVEHIAIDQPVNVVALGAGLHIVNVPTGLAPWSVANQPAWVRITLSERPSNKTLTAGALSYGDGRGHATPFKTGETEDYIYRPAGADGAGPDMEVFLIARTERRIVQDTATKAHDKYANQEVSYFKIEYANRGTALATNALLAFQIPEKLRDGEIILVQTPGIPNEAMSLNFEEIKMTLRPLAPGEAGTIVFGWYGCITCTRASLAATAITATVKVELAGDVNASNNQSSAVTESPARAPVIGAFMDYADDSLLDRVMAGGAATCRASQTFHGRAEPNRIIAILIGLVQVGTTTSDANGDFSFATTLPNGFHRISARYADAAVNAARSATIKSPRDSASGQATGILVNDALPFDPMSVTFTDSQGRTIAVPTLGYSFGATQTGTWLRSGETYTIGVDSCGGDAYRRKGETTLGDVVVSVLTDADGDGRYQGVFTYNPTARAAGAASADELGLTFSDGNMQQSYSVAVQALPSAVVRSAANAQPLTGAAVAALVAQATESAAAFFDLAAASLLGQANPTLTGADGGYGFVAPAGTYRLDVNQTGYQPYRTGDIAVDDGALALDIALAPAVGEAATHTVYVTADGFDPAVLTVQPGSVVEWINLDLDEHGVRLASAWESGLLAAGGRFKVRLDAAGTFAYSDLANPLSQGLIAVDSNTAQSHAIFLPVVTR
ncbi:MAG: hypothetical protein KAX65_04710, partial [Caldilineaceae bacterium]|nr:hypothetical protein [Caldilineaceae bacterium]